MNKKTLSLLLTLFMIMSLLVPASGVAYAEEDASNIISYGNESQVEENTKSIQPPEGKGDPLPTSEPESTEITEPADPTESIDPVEPSEPVESELNAPVLKIKIYSKGFKISWEKIQDAEGYYVYKKVAGHPWKRVNKLSSSKLNYQDSAVTHAKGYYYKVASYNSDTESISATSSLVYFVKGSSLKSVANNLNGKYTIRFNKAKEKVAGYQVQASKSKSFAKKNTLKRSKKLKCTLSGVSKYGHYYFRTRTYIKRGDKYYYSSWSGLKETCLLNVPYVNQKAIGLPAGCEPVSAVNCIKYVKGSKIVGYKEYCDKYLPKGKNGARTNPNKAFMGNPRSRYAWGCYEPVIVRATNRMNAAKGTHVKATPVHPSSVSTLCKKYINNNKPVMIWATVGMRGIFRSAILHFRSGKVVWKSPNHALTLSGYDAAGHYFFSDPLAKKNKSYSKSKVQRRYAKKGHRAVVFTVNK